MSKVQYRIASGNGKYIRLGLNGAARTAISADILLLIHTYNALSLQLKKLR